MNKYIYSRGRRKTASANVRIMPGSGKISINDKVIQGNDIISEVFDLVGQSNKFDIVANVSGGGIKSQIEAIRLGVTRCLVKFSDDFRSVLKKNGFLTRDSREKERKKPGLKRARRAPQWSKR